MSRKSETIRNSIRESQNAILDLRSQCDSAHVATKTFEEKRRLYVKSTLRSEKAAKASEEFVQLFFNCEQSAMLAEQSEEQLKTETVHLETLVVKLKHSERCDLIECAISKVEQRVSLSEAMQAAALKFLKVVADARKLDAEIVADLREVNAGEENQLSSHKLNRIQQAASYEAGACLSQLVNGEQVLVDERIESGRDQAWLREKSQSENLIEMLRNYLDTFAAAA